jgi:DNA-binding transcriptional LysR family regulator
MKRGDLPLRLGQGSLGVFDKKFMVSVQSANLRAFRDTHPKIAIELQEQTSEETVESLLSNQCDLGIGTDLSNATKQGLDVHDNHSDELVLVVPQGHPLSGKTAIAFSDSLSFSHIALHKDSPLYRMLDQAARHAKKSRQV